MGPQSRTKVTRRDGHEYLGVNGYGYHNGITGNVESPAASEPPASQDTVMDSQSEALLVDGLEDVAVYGSSFFLLSLFFEGRCSKSPSCSCWGGKVIFASHG